MSAPTERDLFIEILWAYKATIPRGTPFPKIVVDVEDALWGWSMPKERRSDITSAKKD